MTAQAKPIAEAGHIVNDAPRWFLPLPKRERVLRWVWRIEYGAAVVASGRAWTERGAFRKRAKAYGVALSGKKVRESGLLDRTEPLA
jgi:hypothetical protein